MKSQVSHNPDDELDDEANERAFADDDYEALEEWPPRPTLAARIKDGFKTIWNVGVALVVVFVAAVIAELLEPLQALHRLTEARRDTLLPIVISFTALGFCAFMGSIIYKLVSTRSGEFKGEFSFREIKDAIRTGAWWHDNEWLFFVVVACGAFMMSVGILSTVFVLSPPALKLIIGGVAIYAAVQITWGFWRA